MTQRFQVHLRGIIELLSAHLYSGPEVVVRELLQNGVDALTARQALGPLPLGAGIRFCVLPRSDGPPLLRVSDDGIGLTQDEASLFLATIGQSSKRDDLAGARQEFLGQFGIGLLAGFLISDEIVVHTRSARPTPSGEPAPVVEWIGRNDGTWSSQIRPDLEQGFGTTVTLSARHEMRRFVGSELVSELLGRYGALLPFPVDVIDEDNLSTRVLGDGPAWSSSRPSNKEMARLRALAIDVIGAPPLATIPISSEQGGVGGVAFLLPTPAPVGRRRGDRVYLKGMLVGDDVELLPDWAIFARAVVDARGLRPTASREALFVDETLEQARENLGSCLRRFLMHTAHNDRALLEELLSLHHLGIKQLASQDDELLSIFVDWLPFETSAGAMPFGDIVRRGTRLHYTPHLDEFRQMAPLAAAHGLTLVNAAYTFDVDVLRAGCLLRGVQLERLDAASLAARLEDVDLSDHDSAAALADAARIALGDIDIDIEVKRFHPQTLAAFYGAPDSVLRRRSLIQSRDAAAEQGNPLADALDELIAVQPHERPTLAFNWRTPAVRRLAELCVPDDEGSRPLLSTALRVLYAQALLLGHHPLGARELEALNGGLLSLVEAGVAGAIDRSFAVH